MTTSDWRRGPDMPEQFAATESVEIAQASHAIRTSLVHRFCETNHVRGIHFSRHGL